MGKFVVAAISVVTFVIYLLVLTVPTFSYQRMIAAFFIVAAIGVGLLLLARYAVTITKTVTLKGVGPDFAVRSASQAIWAAEDHVIGWPSGTFTIEWDQHGGLRAKEFLPHGSGNIVLSFVRVPWNIAVGIVAACSLLGVVGFLIGLFLAFIALGAFLFFFVVPLALAWIIEVVFKKPASALIEVSVEDLEDAALLAFRFKGASALIVMNSVMRAFNPPVLPSRYAGLVAAATGAADESVFPQSPVAA